MSALGFDLPKDVESIVDGLESFLQAEVIARHERHADLLDDPRALFDKKGHYVAAARELIREVRMASARAGFYNVCVPPKPSIAPSRRTEPWALRTSWAWSGHRSARGSCRSRTERARFSAARSGTASRAVTPSSKPRRFRRRTPLVPSA